MKRILYSYDKGLYVDDTEIPTPNSDEVLIEMKYAGLCASDLHYIEGRFKYGKIPIVPGHEGSGIVKEVGRDVEELDIGDRVVVDYVWGCGECSQCIMGWENRCGDARYYGFELDGTFQEYMVVPKRNVVQLPRDIPLDIGAIIGCAVVTPYHAIKAVGGVEDRDIAVIGLGGVGIHAILLARILNADKIIGIDIQESKKDIAFHYGADHFINPLEEDPVKEVHSILGDGVDIAFEFVGRPETIRYALDMTRKGGITLLAGLVNEEMPINFIEIIAGEKRIIGVEDHTHNDLKETVELVSENKVDLSRSISHRYGLEDIGDAIDLLKHKYEPVNRIVIEM